MLKPTFLLVGVGPRDLKNAGTLSGYVEYVEDPGKRRVAEEVIEAFRSTVMTTSAHFRHSVIHVRDEEEAFLCTVLLPL